MSTLIGMVTKPLFWAWGFVVVWLTQVGFTLFNQRWDGLTISLIGLLAAVLVVSAFHSRRQKNFYPEGHGGNREPGSTAELEE